MIFFFIIIELIIVFPISEFFATLILFFLPTVAEKIYSLLTYTFSSFPFLSYSKNCAIEFPPEFKSGFIYYKKSLVYPGRGMPDYALTPENLKLYFNRSYTGGGHIVVNYNISENINLMAAYHTTYYRPNCGFTQEFITDNNNKEILITPEDHGHKALKMPLAQAIKSAWDAHYQLAKFHLSVLCKIKEEEAEKISKKCADDTSEKRRQQG